jgi:hypothetical protein
LKKKRKVLRKARKLALVTVEKEIQAEKDAAQAEAMELERIQQMPRNTMAEGEFDASLDYAGAMKEFNIEQEEAAKLNTLSRVLIQSESNQATLSYYAQGDINANLLKKANLLQKFNQRSTRTLEEHFERLPEGSPKEKAVKKLIRVAVKEKTLIMKDRQYSAYQTKLDIELGVVPELMVLMDCLRRILSNGLHTDSIYHLKEMSNWILSPNAEKFLDNCNELAAIFSMVDETYPLGHKIKVQETFKVGVLVQALKDSTNPLYNHLSSEIQNMNISNEHKDSPLFKSFSSAVAWVHERLGNAPDVKAAVIPKKRATGVLDASVGSVTALTQCFKCRGYGHMRDDCPTTVKVTAGNDSDGKGKKGKGKGKGGKGGPKPTPAPASKWCDHCSTATHNTATCRTQKKKAKKEAAVVAAALEAAKTAAPQGTL